MMKALVAIEINGRIEYLEILVSEIETNYGFHDQPTRIKIEGFISQRFSSASEWREAKAEPTPRLTNQTRIG